MEKYPNKLIKIMKYYSKKQILNSKTPAIYIDRCVNSTCMAKGCIAKEWMKRTGYTIEDIKYARHRHPYWKKMKNKNYSTRNKIRWLKYNYVKDHKRYKWNIENIEFFILVDGMNKQLRDCYEYKDKKLAKMLQTTIPSIQYLRRKRNLVEAILKKQGKRLTFKRIIDLIIRDELYLRNYLKGIIK